MVNRQQYADVAATTLTDSTTSTGAANAAAIEAPDGRTTVTVMWNVSGAATVTVEVSTDGTDWYDVTDAFVAAQPSAAETKAGSASVGAEHVRVHVDANLNEAEISAKGA